MNLNYVCVYPIKQFLWLPCLSNITFHQYIRWAQSNKLFYINYAKFAFHTIAREHAPKHV